MLKVSALTAVCVIGIVNYVQASEGIARQVQALKSSMDSFAATARAQLAAQAVSITENVRMIDAFKTCADKNMLYTPENQAADVDGCSAMSGSGEVNEIDMATEVVPTNQYFNVEHGREQTGGGGVTRGSPARIYQINDSGNYQTYQVVGNIRGWGWQWDDEDHAYDHCYAYQPYVKIGGRWHVSDSDTVTIRTVANQNKTILNGRMVNGSFDKRIAVAKGTAFRCGRRGDTNALYQIFNDMRKSHVTWSDALASGQRACSHHDPLNCRNSASLGIHYIVGY
ncbi:MAG: hypothetical protein VX730_07915 [Pseudomonadota bacterium]|nr:hypothetical protein [Pseudomonadota bacterium]